VKSVATVAKESFFEGIRRFFRNVIAELKKVNWPSQKELRTYTIVVIITVIVTSAIIFTWDLVLAFLMKGIIR
jgi:preprotein translocase subunit SecE